MQWRCSEILRIDHWHDDAVSNIRFVPIAFCKIYPLGTILFRFLPARMISRLFYRALCQRLPDQNHQKPKDSLRFIAELQSSASADNIDRMSAFLGMAGISVAFTKLCIIVLTFYFHLATKVA
jgi:hypothetical protein